MLIVKINVPTIALKLSQSTATTYCHIVLHQVNAGDAKSLYDLAAVWLYNKLSTKLAQKQLRLAIPLEYAMMLHTYCQRQPMNTDYILGIAPILEQIDKQLK